MRDSQQAVQLWPHAQVVVVFVVIEIILTVEARPWLPCRSAATVSVINRVALYSQCSNTFGKPCDCYDELSEAYSWVFFLMFGL